MGNLASVEGRLYIDSNEILTDVAGLSSLASVGKDLRIYNCPALTSLGLDALVTLSCLDVTGSCLWINGNSSLPQCEACDLLGQLVDFTGTTSFYNNQQDSCSYTCD
jgi:hypothetical protein